MSAWLCIGAPEKARNGISIAEFQLAAVDVLLDFVLDQEDRDGQDYRTQMSPLRQAIAEGPGDPDHLDVWATGEEWPTTQIADLLELAATLLERHGEAWQRDPEWEAAGLQTFELERQLRAALDRVTEANHATLLTWIRR